MDIKIVIFLGLIALAVSKDLKVGNEDGEKILDEKKEVSPAIWVQDHNVTVTANDTELITGVTVTDLRSEKDGEVKIVEGGVGEKNVTIELKSPGVFRGYGFHVEVYAATAEEYIKNSDQIPSQGFNNNQAHTGNGDTLTKMLPANLASDIKVDKREATEKSQSTVAPKVKTTTKDFKNPAVIAKDGKDHDDNKNPIVPLVMPLLKPAVHTRDSAESDETSEEEASIPEGDYNIQEVKLKNDSITLSKNDNVDTKTTGSVISSKTTPAPRNARVSNGATTITTKTNSATDNVEGKTNAPANTTVQDMKPYPILKEDLNKKVTQRH